MWRIVLNTARESRRRERRTVSVADFDAVESDGTSDGEASELRVDLRALPERQRLAVFLHYYGDLPYDEVARLLDIAPGTVAASLHAARKKLRLGTFKEGHK